MRKGVSRNVTEKSARMSVREGRVYTVKSDKTEKSDETGGSLLTFTPAVMSAVRRALTFPEDSLLIYERGRQKRW